jgi:hypothetical protein
VPRWFHFPWCVVNHGGRSLRLERSFTFKRYILWDIAQCSPLKVNRGFGGKFLPLSMLDYFLEHSSILKKFRNFGRLADNYTALLQRK